MPVQTQLQQRRGTAASWTSTNPTLAAGEIGFESDTGKFKIGNGSTAWASLAYATNGAVVSPLTTKGDLFTYSTTNARLAVGANGETLVADSSTSTGLRWQGSQAAGKNGVINGGFDIWQRGTSSTLNVGYGSADRWYQFIGSGTGTYARESTVIPLGSQYSMKFTASSAGTGHSLTQYFETATVESFINRTVTVSAQVAASTSTAMSITLATSTTVDAGAGASWTTVTATSGGTATPTSTTFVNLTGVYAIPSTAQSIRLTVGPQSTTANGVVIYYGNVQLELGSVPTTFTRAGGTIQGELAACQRYYYRATGGSAYQLFGGGLATGSTTVNIQFNHLVTMRATPTSVQYSTINITDNATIDNAVSAVTQNQQNPNVSMLQMTTTGLTQGRFYNCYANNSSNAFVAVSAEL